MMQRRGVLEMVLDVIETAAKKTENSCFSSLMRGSNLNSKRARLIVSDLVEKGVLTKTEKENPKGGRGRPAAHYNLSETGIEILKSIKVIKRILGDYSK